ncbi:MAG: hypothetical protein AB1441_08460 [Bacillota bacterium]
MKQWLLAALAGAILLSLAADLLLRGAHGHGKFWWHELYGFDLLFGFLGCLALVWVSRALGKHLVQRGEDYYDR